jgi:hypothetical protein
LISDLRTLNAAVVLSQRRNHLMKSASPAACFMRLETKAVPPADSMNLSAVAGRAALMTGSERIHVA